jgi:hypothetical protein
VTTKWKEFEGVGSFHLAKDWAKLWSETYALLGCYAQSSGNPLPTFRDNVWVSSSRVKKSKKSDP